MMFVFDNFIANTDKVYIKIYKGLRTIAFYTYERDNPLYKYQFDNTEDFESTVAQFLRSLGL